MHHSKEARLYLRRQTLKTSVVSNNEDLFISHLKHAHGFIRTVTQ